MDVTTDRGASPATDADVIIVGAGPTGLMLASELRLAGVRPVVLERHPRRRDTPKAGGLGGQILELLRYRGLLQRCEAACAGPVPAARFPFGGVHLDLTGLADPPLHALPLGQRRLEGVLDELAGELGVDVRRGHDVVAVSQDGSAVTMDVRGPDGPYRLLAQYAVGCDGARSQMRHWAGIAFPGTDYPEVNRLAQVTLPETVTVLGNGDLDVPDFGTIHAGFTRTGKGLLGVGASPGSKVVSVYTVEDETTEYDDEKPMTVTELQDSVRRVLGVQLPVEKPIRLSRFTFKARQAERYRNGRILLAGDAAHLFPATGVALNAGMLDAVNLAWKIAADINGWAPAALLDTYHHERHLAGTRTMLHTQAQVALRRGHDPAAEALREVFQELLADEQPLRRMAALVAGTDIRYPVPGSYPHPLAGTFAPDLTLHTDQGVTSVAELMQAARPILLDLTGRPDLCQIARDWRHRVDVHTAKVDRRPADVLLIRPDAHIVWAATVDEPDDTAEPALREALSFWFGTPCPKRTRPGSLMATHPVHSGPRRVSTHPLLAAPVAQDTHSQEEAGSVERAAYSAQSPVRTIKESRDK
ncbi:FAD-dependent monooxygenase [Micromonospora globispora]|uniref:FAD-dependent monooxygenase n=1 Tax=Micromonospora globispora TaxID=1450148 RepID=UPI001FAFDE02|nr:FAD-dependent monooxygenase [Micromonospora globispora]